MEKNQTNPNKVVDYYYYVFLPQERSKLLVDLKKILKIIPKLEYQEYATETSLLDQLAVVSKGSLVCFISSVEDLRRVIFLLKTIELKKITEKVAVFCVSLLEKTPIDGLLKHFPWLEIMPEAGGAFPLIQKFRAHSSAKSKSEKTQGTFACKK